VRDGAKRKIVLPLPTKLNIYKKAVATGSKKFMKQDLRRGLGQVYLPFALRKYPNAGKEWAWQYVFPSKSLSVNPAQSQAVDITFRLL